MSDRIRLVMAQLNLLVGDVPGNTEIVVRAAARARDELAADAVIFPELTLTGYPPDDLLLRNDFIRAVERGIGRLCAEVNGVTLVVGAPRQDGDALYNSAYVIRDGRVTDVYDKYHLPTYGVFDDRRYFDAGGAPCVVDIDGCRLGVTICEDAWHPGPVTLSAETGADVVANLNASPFDHKKWAARESVLRERIGEAGVPIVYCNMAGGQDEVVYDGGSCAFDADGGLAVRAPRFETGLYPVDLARGGSGWRPVDGDICEDVSEEACVYDALVWGVRDYVEKNGFPGVLIGLSGGMDSALVAAIAVDALGPERVECVMMPSRYTSDTSHTDAAELARNLGVHYHSIAIEGIFGAFLEALAPVFGDAPPDVTEENLQSRSRGTLLMALSNKFGRLVLATGNKSELAVGYATLYGDMVGGFAPLKDVFKTEAYRLAAYRNERSAVIPQNIFAKAPTAELRAGQRDSDSLPEYPELDSILAAYVEEDAGIDEIVAAGHDETTVRRVVRMLHGNEYKRRQAPPGVKITTKAFGRDRRYPITSGFSRIDAPRR
ncbi:NAD+ synthase [Arhodomonas aquaeolei]|uniref:NAD+ synthase n=1 Tax=Arhodomonas aquaeolei TaxID=2369 RepID=UPI000377193D|nr:NAD+ synthase [Arhodomonas aquaeolei]